MDANIHQRAEFAPNSLSPFCRDVLVKAEPPDDDVPEQFKYQPQQHNIDRFLTRRFNFSIPQFDALVPNVKLERPSTAPGLHAKSSSERAALFHETRGPNNQRLFCCNQCSFRSKHKVSLLRHIKLHSPEDMQSFKCATCGFETLYRRHMDVHTKVLHGRDGATTKLYKCDQCSYACNYRENLSRHKKTHLAPEDRNSFVCQICQFQTFYKKSFRVHMEMIHQIVTDAKPEESEFKCYHCPFETKYRVNIVRHLKTHMKGVTTIYKCTDCDFQTIHKTNFNTHVLRHKDPGKIKIFQCQHCSHKTFYKASLRNHLKLHMKKEEIETYTCDLCTFDTIYERSLKLHVLYMHNGNHQAIEYFKCHFCNFETRYRENWRRHEKGHSKPGKRESYNCNQCSFSTIQQGRFERHLRTHASPEQLLAMDERPQKKSEARKRFRAVIDTPTSLVLDAFKAQTFTDGTAEEQTMFQCNYCAYKTLTRQLLDVHLATHQEPTSSVFLDECTLLSNKPEDCKNVFVCEHCSFKTMHRSSMRRHRETHLRPSERKEFKCPTCVFRSYTRARVNRHKCPNRNMLGAAK